MSIFGGLGELLLPRSCAGCGCAGTVLCGVCRTQLREPPHLVARSQGHLPLYALGEYTQLRRNLIIAMKEYNNAAVRPYVGAVFAAGIRHLQAAGELPVDIVLIPAPTRPRSARLRGGDPVLHICQSAAAQLGCAVVQAVRINPRAQDQSELGAKDRWANMQGSVQLVGADLARVCGSRPAVLVDDVVTTGATLAVSAQVLRGAGVLVAAGLAFADAH